LDHWFRSRLPFGGVVPVYGSEFCLDVIEIMTVFSSKTYGLRTRSNRKKIANAQVRSVK
jgi:hypothetical protein